MPGWPGATWKAGIPGIGGRNTRPTVATAEAFLAAAERDAMSSGSPGWAGILGSTVKKMNLAARSTAGCDQGVYEESVRDHPSPDEPEGPPGDVDYPQESRDLVHMAMGFRKKAEELIVEARTGLLESGRRGQHATH